MLDALHDIEDLPGVTVSKVQAVSMTRGHYERVVKVKLEIMVADSLVARVVAAIREHAHTGRAGDGGIFVLPVEQAIAIRTGARVAEGSAD